MRQKDEEEAAAAAAAAGNLDGGRKRVSFAGDLDGNRSDAIASSFAPKLSGNVYDDAANIHNIVNKPDFDEQFAEPAQSLAFHPESRLTKTTKAENVARRKVKTQEIETKKKNRAQEVEARKKFRAKERKPGRSSRHKRGMLETILRHRRRKLKLGRAKAEISTSGGAAQLRETAGDIEGVEGGLVKQV
jgi:hypothetical protein